MWNVMSTIKPRLAKNMIHNARLNRSAKGDGDNEHVVEIKSEIYEELKKLPSQKRKYHCYFYT